MKQYPMITISREYGSNGRKIGELLAQRLGLPFYDKDIIAIASKETRFAEEAFENAEKTATTSLGYALSNRSNRGLYGMPWNDQLFMVQSSVIRTLADQGPAIFVGRCADYVLSGYKASIDIFLQASEEARVQTIMDREKVSKREAENSIRRYDKSRATYYNYYTDRKWGDIQNYDIALNVSHLTPEEAADLLATFINQVVEKTSALETK
ncbi:MAG: cytidylate kinase-like family protein [Oscillospiraceae bacterium]|nr:cytidylate kinase-like family protein [Oscillospiraceae bacterium]